ncbi:MAG TPA: hypothetical protein VNE41_01790 [Chitinophagaceae bacterium]|nr:hypothetical protein [Chitinophagaceae bacterium]
MLLLRLLPHRFKIIGWLILIPASFAGVLLSFSGFQANWLYARVFAIFPGDIFGFTRPFSFIRTNITDTVVGILCIGGAMLVAFSREKKEDEYIASIRFSSLLWAVCINYFFLLLAFLFVYGTSFLTVMVYNMFTVLILFITRFNYLLFKHAKPVPDEK